MGVLRKLIPATSQPSGSPVLAGTPFLQGLLALITGKSAFQRTRPIIPAASNNQVYIATPSGIARSASNNSQVSVYVTSPYFTTGYSAPFTIFNRHIAGNINSVTGTIIACMDTFSGGTSIYYGSLFALIVQDGYYAITDNVSQVWNTGIPESTDGLEHTIVLTFDIYNIFTLYKDGNIVFSLDITMNGDSYAPYYFTLGNNSFYFSSGGYASSIFASSGSPSTTAKYSSTLIDAMWDRALSPQEVATLHKNTWQLFQPTQHFFYGVTVIRPSSDQLTTGWASTTSTISDAINEAAPNDLSYAISPALTTAGPVILNLSNPVPMGTSTLNIRSKAGTGAIKATLLTADGQAVGSTRWQGLTSAFSIYSLPISTTQEATQVKLEVMDESTVVLLGTSFDLGLLSLGTDAILIGSAAAPGGAA